MRCALPSRNVSSLANLASLARTAEEVRTVIVDLRGQVGRAAPTPTAHRGEQTATAGDHREARVAQIDAVPRGRLRRCAEDVHARGHFGLANHRPKIASWIHGPPTRMNRAATTGSTSIHSGTD